MPKYFLLVMGILALLILAGLVLRFAWRPKFAGKPILTKNELEFYQRLRTALPDLLIFPQVALRAIIRPGSKGRRYFSELGLIGSKHCDFLLCRPDTLDVVAIVELDDRTHDKDRDARRDAMTAAAGYQTVRYESRKRPDVEKIRADILALPVGRVVAAGR